MDWFKYAKEVLSDKRIPRNLLVFLILILGFVVSIMYYNNQKNMGKLINSTQVIDSLLIKTTLLENKLSRLQVDFIKQDREDDNRYAQIINQYKNDLRLALVAMSKNVKEELIIELLNLNKVERIASAPVIYDEPVDTRFIEKMIVNDVVSPIKLISLDSIIIDPIIYKSGELMAAPPLDSTLEKIPKKRRGIFGKITSFIFE